MRTAVGLAEEGRMTATETALEGATEEALEGAAEEATDGAAAEEDLGRGTTDAEEMMAEAEAEATAEELATETWAATTGRDDLAEAEGLTGTEEGMAREDAAEGAT